MAVSAKKQEMLLRVLEQEKPNFSVFEKHEVQKAEAWSGELAMLRRRIATRFEMLPLPGGDSIAVRTCLTEAEEAHLAELFVRIFAKGDQDAPYEVIELCTANPEITEEWLRANPDAFAVQDLLDVLYGYLERKQALRQEAADRVRRIVSFRIERDGKGSG